MPEREQPERPIRRLCVDPVSDLIVGMGDGTSFFGSNRDEAVGAITDVIQALGSKELSFAPNERIVRSAVQNLQRSGNLKAKCHFNRSSGMMESFEFIVRV